MSKPRLRTLRPVIEQIGPAIRVGLAGDDRIRGWHLTAIRHRIFARDCGRCQCARCKATGDVRLAEFVDHIVPLWAGGQETDGNRQSISKACHDAKSAHEALCRQLGVWHPWQG